MMKKKTYLQPDCKVIEVKNECIIATSGSTEAYDLEDTDDWFNN